LRAGGDAAVVFVIGLHGAAEARESFFGAFIHFNRDWHGRNRQTHVRGERVRVLQSRAVFTNALFITKPDSGVQDACSKHQTL
jgi:hypothetical protein